MLERYLGQIAVAVALVMGAVFWLMQDPAQPVVEVIEAAAPVVAPVRTRVVRL